MGSNSKSKKSLKNITNSLNAIDLFCGCGGMSLGLIKSGYNVIAAFDNWIPALEVYRKNFSHPVYQMDLGNDDSHKLITNMHPDIIVGGPPCQDFSDAGPRNEKLGRASLTSSFADIVIKSKPKYFVMENVCRIVKTNIYKSIFKRLKDAGYGLSAHVLNASFCGVPQARKRFFLIGHLTGPDNFLYEIINDSLSEKQMTVHDYLGTTLGVEYYFRIPRSYTRRGVFSIYEPSVTIRGVERPIPSNYKKHPGDPVEIGPQVRSLTVIERSYIQTFPKTFVFEGTKSNLNQMIGNAVPVNLAEFVGKAIISYDNIIRRGINDNG